MSNPLLLPLKFVHSTFVWSASFAVMGSCVIVGGGLSPIIPFKKTHNYVGGPFMGACLRLATSKLDITYHRDFDKNRRAVFIQTHVNLLDAHAACAAIPHAFCGLMNAWQFKIPLYGHIMRLADGIAVYPKSEGRFKEVASAARDRAKKGISILAFPEGHRTLDGTMREFKRGVFFMAKTAKLPIVPLATHGMFNLMRKGSMLINRGPVKIFVGPQIETKGLKSPQFNSLIERTHAVISTFSETGEVDEELVRRLQNFRDEPASVTSDKRSA